MGIAVNIDSVGTQQFNIVGAEKITHTQPTYYNPISTRYQDTHKKKIHAEKYSPYRAEKYYTYIFHMHRKHYVYMPHIEGSVDRRA